MWYFSRLTDFLAPKGEEKTLALVNASVSPLKYHIQTKSVFQKYTRGEFFRRAAMQGGGAIFAGPPAFVK